MADIWIDVDAALAEVPVNLMPLIDDTDFKSIEGAVAYDAAGMALRWHFVTTAGAYTVTSVTPTTAGVHDWTDQGDSGVYTIEIPASGGTINNDTEGFGWFTGVATGILPWRGPVIGFRASGLNDLLIDSAYSTTRGLAGTALPAAAAEAAGGLFTRGTGAGQINQTVNGLANTNVINLAGSAISQAAGVADVNVVSISGDTAAADALESYCDGTTPQPVDVTAISGDATAANNLEAYCDGTTPQPVNITHVIGDAVQASSSKTTNWGGTP